MKKNYLVLSLLSLFISACGPVNRDSSSVTNPSSGGEGETSSSSESSASSSEEPYTPRLSELNPMAETYINRQFYLNHIGDIYNTWRSYQGDGVTIAVIDRWFNPRHEDFTFEDGSSKVTADTSGGFVTYSSASEANKHVTTGYATGRTVFTPGLDAATDTSDSHGTFCAGVAAAGINGKGVIGVAPLAKLMLLKTDGTPSSVNAAFRHAADKGAKVITISIGSYNSSSDTPENGDLIPDGSGAFYSCFDESVTYCRNKGVVVVSAAGNGGLMNSDTTTRERYTYPGATSGVIGVGGLAGNSSDKMWDGTSYNHSVPNYSKYEDMFCDVFAPSDYMFGCVNHGGKKYEGNTEHWQGTSFASPIVAGIAALYFEKNPNNSVTKFEHDLYSACYQFGDPTRTGYGRVDVGKLLGTKSSGNTAIRIRNSGRINYYIWDSRRQNSYKVDWPGEFLGTYDDHLYSMGINLDNYDSVIFNTFNSKDDTDGVQTVDLAISSFTFNKTYNLDAIEEMHGFLVGKYV